MGISLPFVRKGLLVKVNQGLAGNAGESLGVGVVAYHLVASGVIGRGFISGGRGCFRQRRVLIGEISSVDFNLSDLGEVEDEEGFGLGDSDSKVACFCGAVKIPAVG